MPCIRLVGRIQLHLLPTTVALLHDSKKTTKQIKTIARMASTGLDIKMKVIIPSLQEVAIATTTTTVMHEISSTPGVMDAEKSGHRLLALLHGLWF